MTPRQISKFPERTVDVGLADVTLRGDLTLPQDARGIVIFAHGSGSSRKSSRNRYVASVLQDAGLATLLFDLLTEDEEQVEQFTRHLRFDIGLLARRLAGTTAWVDKQQDLAKMTIGYFGASTGGGAAIVAAASLGMRLSAVVSRGGRPDLAGEALSKIRCPTLLIVGGSDDVVIDLNRKALAQMNAGVGKLEIIPGATHLFEEPGTLEQAALLAKDWLKQYLEAPGSV
jgi:putative phosphoribosyl transferase